MIPRVNPGSPAGQGRQRGGREVCPEGLCRTPERKWVSESRDLCFKALVSFKTHDIDASCLMFQLEWESASWRANKRGNYARFKLLGYASLSLLRRPRQPLLRKLKKKPCMTGLLDRKQFCSTFMKPISIPKSSSVKVDNPWQRW